MDKNINLIVFSVQQMLSVLYVWGIFLATKDISIKNKDKNSFDQVVHIVHLKEK